MTSVSGSEAVLTRSMLERAIDARKGRPVFVIDLGVPRNVAADAAGLYSLYLYNIDDLGEIVEQNKKAREAEIPRAEALIAEQIAKFESWCANLAAGSIVDDLRDALSPPARAILARTRCGECEPFARRTRSHGATHRSSLSIAFSKPLPNRCATAAGCGDALARSKRFAIFGVWTIRTARARSDTALSHRHARQRARSMAGESRS